MGQFKLTHACCHPERSLARILRQTQSKDLLLFSAAAPHLCWLGKKSSLRFAQDDNSFKYKVLSYAYGDAA